MAIPVALVYFARRKRDVPFRTLFVLFGIFIVSCGFSHLAEAWTFQVPMYRLSGLIKAVTAVASLATVVALLPIMPQALNLRSPRELEREIQERKRAEAELAERARALDEANRKLRETERLKDEFFANVSHELRTPLTLILAPLESVLAADERFSADERQHLQTMHNNAVRLLQLINGLLDFSRLEAGQHVIDRQSTDIAALTRSLLADFRPLVEKKELRLELQIDLDAPSVSIDKYLYERILFNLLSNAVKFTADGTDISVRLSQAESELILEVQDHGIGIAAAHVPHLFQKFHQLEGSSTRRFEGTGLGLAMVKEFAELLGGEVTVSSQVGVGSTFRVRLQAPICETPVEKDDQPRHTVTLPKYEIPLPDAGHVSADPKPRVLIVEDNPELAASVARLLRHVCQTSIAADGDRGLELARNWQPDLVLADVMMPRRDGLALCHDIKSSPQTRHIPVVLLTALTHREALLKGWEAGADEYLYKPFHPSELITRVRTLLGANLARKEAERQMRELNQSLELRVRERTAELMERADELQRLNADLTRVNQDLDDFTYIASHDLKEPLRGIEYYSRILIEDNAENLNDDGRRKLDTIGHLSRRMAELIDSLHRYSRVGRVELSVTLCDVEGIVEEVLDSLHFLIAERNVAVRVHRPLPKVYCDPTGLREVLHNLIANAVKYNNKDEKWVEIGFRDTETPAYYVRDNGIGIREKHQETIFRIFKRLHGRDDFGGGAGAGLTIAKKIVERHGGCIWVESTFGAGATFYFSLV